jgi:DNA-binding phage protein
MKKDAARNVSASDYTTQLLEELKDPAEAAAYVEAAIQEGDGDGLAFALCRVNTVNGSNIRITPRPK